MRTAYEPLFWLSHGDQRMTEWKSCASSLTAPCPLSPQGGLAGIQEGLPRQGTQAKEENLSNCWFRF